MKRAYYKTCPRCGDGCFEVLSNHGHCTGCLYFEDYYSDAETAFAAARALEAAYAQMEVENEIENDEELEDQAA